jgi:1-acyl-sn-glycerol-3-phosphate acyltransferase
MALAARSDDFPIDDPATRLLAVVNAFVRECRGKSEDSRAATLDSALATELALDSLGRVELLLRVERAFGVALPEGTLADAETPRDLLRAVLAGAPGHREAHVATRVQVAGEQAGAAPESATTLVEALDWHVQHQPHRIHMRLLEGDESPTALSYAALRADAEAIAGGLQREGLEPRVAVAIMLPTGRDFFAAYFGVLIAGGIPVPIYPPLRLAQLADHVRRQAAILSNCAAHMLITVREAKPVGSLLRGHAAALERVVTADDLRARAARPTPVPLAAQDIAFIQYTSGSTGNPKGAVLTHANLLANIRAMGRAIGVTSTDVFVSWLPLYHDMGLIGAWLGSLYYAMPLVVMSPLDFLSRPARWLWAIHRYGGTLSAAPNFAYELAAARLDERELEGLDLSSWRWAFNGAEPVSPNTMRRFAERFARYGFDPKSLAPVYGLAECALDLAFPPGRRGVLVDRIDREQLAKEAVASPAAVDDQSALEVVACGRPLAGYEIRIAPAGGRELPERHVERIWFKGPSATSGYFRNPRATAQLFDGEWLDTGDLGYIAAGELYVTGRSKDMMIRGGQNVYPYELEEAVGNVPGIRKGCVAVFGVPDSATAAERVVVLAETRVAAPEERAALVERIHALASELIAGPADEVVLAPPHTVLKTSSGKIRRSASRELYERGVIGARRSAVWRELAALALRSARGRIGAWWRGVVAVAYSVYVWFEIVVLAALVAIAAFALPARAARVSMRFLARAALWLAGLRVQVEGLEEIPRAGPAVAVANHASYVDGLLFFALLPARFTFAVKEGFSRNRFMRHVFSRAGGFFVERFDVKRGVEDTRGLSRLVAAGGAAAIFPEGTFTRSPGLAPFRMGAFVIAAEAGAPVVPVAFRGSRSVLRANDWIVRRGFVRVVIEPPIVPEGADWSAAVRLRNAARSAILHHCGEPDLADDAFG